MPESVSKSVICDIVGCNDEATNRVDAENADGYFSVNMCRFHYKYFRADESLNKPIHVKDVPIHERNN